MDLFTIIFIIAFVVLPLVEALARKGKERERIEEMRREEEEDEAAVGGGEWRPLETEDEWDTAPEEERSFMEEIEARARQQREESRPAPAPRETPRALDTARSRPAPAPKPAPAPQPRAAPRPEPSLESFAAPDEAELSRYRSKLAAPTHDLEIEEIGGAEAGQPGTGGLLDNFRSARSVSEAIVMAEILGPPRALRSLEEERRGD